MKKVWIINHYAINHYFNEGGRHYWFAENLMKKGYNPTILTSNIRHNSDDVINVENKRYKSYTDKNKVPYFFIKTTPYIGNGLNRIKNMYSFYKNTLKSYKDIINEVDKPDVILASSVHPLSLVAGIKIAKKLKIPCICEIRDLWPESLVAYGSLKRNSLVAKLLFMGEKWIYKRADSIIMTWEGGKEYIIDQGWDNEVQLDKIHHINNGLVIQDFDFNKLNYKIEDPDLDKNKNIVYTGSIRKVNNLGLLLDVAKIITEKGHNDIKFLIYGSGDEKQKLKDRCVKEKITNVIFKGKVEKKYIPNILSRSYINILHNSSTSLNKYGQSQNKMFEYLAAGKCIIQTYTTGYSIIDKYDCGISVEEQNANEIADTIMSSINDENIIKKGENARKLAYEYDFEKLTNQLIELIDGKR